MARVGLAMGARGADAALEQVRIVLMHDRLDNFVAAFRLSQNARRMIRQNPIASLGTVAVLVVGLIGCGRGDRGEVVVYAAQDQVYSEPILAEFTRLTGTRVRAVYDSEAVKTVGLANRLLAEKANPQCDVFWGNEELRARQLAVRGAFRETNGLATFGYRTRRIVINTKRLALADAPRSLLDLTNAVWRGKVALAYPLFGTTVTHFLALRRHWGEPGWVMWCRALQANRPFVVDGNSVVVKTVGRGDAVVGLTDSDDIAAFQREGLPVATVPVTAETLVIPNVVAVVRHAPHPREAEALFQYLQRPEVLQSLVNAGALEGAVPDGERGLQVDWGQLLLDLDAATEALRRIFLR